MIRTDITNKELEATVTALLNKLCLPQSADILVCSKDKLTETHAAVVLCEDDDASDSFGENAHVLTLPLDFSAFAELMCKLAYTSCSDGVKVKDEPKSFSFDAETGVITKGTEKVTLSAKERDLFAYLLKASPRGVSREELRRALWKDTEGTNAPDVYVSYLRRKLRPIFGDAVIVNERGVGYIMKNIT